MTVLRWMAAAALAAGLGLAGASGASAAPLTVQSYSMPNGGTGSFDYRDFSYSNCVANDCNITGAALSGGVGKLTDGVSPAGNWNAYGQNTPWVGWYTGYTGGTNPDITFNFASPVTINSVTVWVDNSLGAGGVFLPGSVTIGATNHLIAPDFGNGAPRGYTFNNLNLSGSSVNVQFFQSQYAPWIMVGEISFDGAINGVGVPEPASWALMIMGFGAVGAMMRRRREAMTPA